MTVTAVTPVDAAADPKHPDHDRWVKEHTLAREVAHAQQVGKSFRDAENENAYWLARAEARAREAQPVAAPAPVRKPREEKRVEQGVTVTAPSIKQVKPSPCGRCGLCRNCMRERRVLLIMQKRKESPFFENLAMPLIMASRRAGRFARMRRGDYERAVTALCEEACNLSIPRLGKWE